MSLPIACSLTDSQLQERRNNVLHKVRSAVLEVKEMENGYAYFLPSDGDWFTELANLVNLERQCCPFLRISVTVEPNGGPLCLELSGPEGTKEFLEATFN